MTSSLRVALIGYGYAGKTFHAPLINAASGLHLSRIASSDAAKVAADSPNLPGVQIDRDPRQAIEHPDIDLVVIASPNDTHAPLAHMALAAGKHVVIDKPFTVTTDDARALIEQAQQAKRLLSVFHNRRWDGDFLALKRLIAADTLGEIVHFESHFSRFRPEVQPRWREKAGPGGGLWYDLGPHLIDQALQLFGMPRAVSGKLIVQRPLAETTDWCHVQLDYGSRQVILHASMLVAGGTPRFAVHGMRGSWIKYGLDTQEDQLKAGMLPGAAGWGDDPRPGTLHGGGQSHGVPSGAVSGDYRHYYQGVRDAIAGVADNPVPPQQALAVMEILDLAIESNDRGCSLPYASRLDVNG